MNDKEFFLIQKNTLLDVIKLLGKYLNEDNYEFSQIYSEIVKEQLPILQKQFKELKKEI